MKIAKYNGIYYLYISNKKTCNIVTTRNKKLHEGFISENGAYYKKIQETDVSEIFEVQYRVKYDSGIPGIPTEWGVGSGVHDIKDEKILIKYANGVLPGWDIEEKNVCIKYVNKNDIEYGEVIKIFYKKNDVVLTTPERVVERVDVETFIRIHKEYQRNNI